MTSLSSNIFMNQSEFPKEEHKLCKDSIQLSIPENSVNTPDLEMEKTQTEWRWRFLKFGNKEVVEISFKKPTDLQRTFMNKFGDWVKTDIGKTYDTYVIKEMYNYTSD